MNKGTDLLPSDLEPARETISAKAGGRTGVVLGEAGCAKEKEERETALGPV